MLFKYKKIWLYLNLWRVIPAYLFLKSNKFKSKALKDFERWKEAMSTDYKTKSALLFFGYLILYEKAFRNIFHNRLHRNPIMFLFAYIFFRPLDSLYINMPPENIGGGFYIQHGFSTIIAAKKIGENCSINQQVTIGYNKSDAPIICNDCTICAGAIVIGKTIVNDNTVIGAGAVVCKDTEKDSIMVGVPAKNIKNN